MMTSIVRQQSLQQLLQDVVASSIDVKECMLADISMDSRRVAPGALFISLAKDTEQREKHLQQALDKGAFAVVYEQDQGLTATEKMMLDEAVVSAYPVVELAQRAGFIAAQFYQHPSQQMTVIAITGTNGKTSVSQFIAQALESLGRPCGIIGTLGAGRLSDLELTGMTTPDPVTMQRLLADFVLLGCQYVVMEASSHALEQGRLNSIEIDVAVLTNLTRDHLDYHKSMASYAKAKQVLFEFASLQTAILNENDSFGRQLATTLAGKTNVMTYSSAQRATVSASNVDCHRDGIGFDVQIEQDVFAVSVPLLGQFNIDNMLATISVLHELGFSSNEIKAAVSYCHSVAGRMEAYGNPNQPTVVIDYAHTPDALEQALITLRTHLSGEGKLWCVFGCGGDRDRGKRSLMGSIAEQLADKVIITDDNPRTEDHSSIVSDILSGCQQPEKIRVEHDRKQAISYAIIHADATDIVLVAGKGHEAYQEINEVKYPFSDAHVVTETLMLLHNGITNVAGGH